MGRTHGRASADDAPIAAKRATTVARIIVTPGRDSPADHPGRSFRMRSFTFACADRSGSRPSASRDAASLGSQRPATILP